MRAHEAILGSGETAPFEEVLDVISLPKYDENIHDVDVDSVEIDDKVVDQLRDYVRTIASLYPHNPFHNYDHAR